MTDFKISIAWQNLSYHRTSFLDWKNFGRRQTILRNISGSFHAYSLNAVLGPSGAGKSSLLHSLNGTNPSRLSAETEIFIRPTSRHRHVQPVSYFIEQQFQETIHSELTVKEVLVFAFRFKNGISSLANQQVNSHINSVMDKLLLKPELLSRKFCHCSGGEQKRVAIAQELMTLTPPDFLFLDEPTTGLDSFAALEVIRCLASLVSSTSDHQLTIVASIHTPSDELLQYFSQLYVLAKGGVCVYSGPPEQLDTFLQQTVPVLNCQTKNTEHSIETLIRYACDDYRSTTTLALSERTLSSELAKTQSQAGSLQRQFLSSNYKAYSLSDQLVLLHRQLKLSITQFTSIATELFFFMLGILFISAFFNPQMVTRDGCLRKRNINDTTATLYPSFSEAMLTYENFNYLYFNRLFQSFAFSVLGATTFHSLVNIFRSEHRNRFYSSGVFFITTQITYSIKVTVFSVVISTLLYFIVGEYAIDDHSINWSRFLLYNLLIWLKLLYGQSLGELCSVLISNYEMAVGLTSVLFASHMIMDNNFVQTDDFTSPILRICVDLFGHKYFVNYLVYIFYGFQRCDGEGDVSWIMSELKTDSNQANYYLIRIILYVFVLKMTTYLIIVVKFNIDWNVFELPSWWCHLSSNNNNEKAISVISNNHFVSDIDNSLLTKSCDHTPDILLAFTNLTLQPPSSLLTSPFENRHRNKSAPILQSLNGQFNSGTLTAVMGMSGAGKTSLLKVLNGQYSNQLSFETTFYVSNKTHLRKVFIAQQVTDHLFSGLTVKQSLMYASKLKNASETVPIDHEGIALKLLDELSMSEVANRKVQHCSGGEQKRLAIALELTSIHMPNLICIDEPTSGLDSNTSEKVISILRLFAEVHNIAIIASIHQPNTRLLNTFHQLYILSIGGVCIYSGAPSSVAKHLQLAQISMGKYAIETAIHVSCAGADDPIVQKLSQENHKNTVVLEKSTYSTKNLPPNRSRFSLKSTWILFNRYLAYIYAYKWIELTVAFVFVILYGHFPLMIFKFTDTQKPVCITNTISFDADFNSEDTIKEQFHPLLSTIKYISLISVFFAVQISVLFSGYTIYREMPLFLNEHRNGTYSTGSYFLMKSIVDIFILFLILLPYTYIVNTFDRPGLYPYIFFLLVISCFIAQSTCHAIFLLCRCDVILTSITLSVFYFVNILLCNVFIPLNQTTVLQFISNGALFRHTLEAFFLQVYGFGRCKEREIQPILEYMALNDADYPVILLKLGLNLIFWKALALYLLTRKVNFYRKTKREINF